MKHDQEFENFMKQQVQFSPEHSKQLETYKKATTTNTDNTEKAEQAQTPQTTELSEQKEESNSEKAPENEPPVTEADSGSEEKQLKGVNKRVHDAQMRLHAETQKNAKLRNMILTKIPGDLIVFDENTGDPIDIDYSRKPVKQKEEEIPPEPDEDLFISDPKKANDMARERNNYFLKKEMQEEKKREEVEKNRIAKANEFKDAINQSYQRTMETFPDFAVKDSDLNIRMSEIFREDPALMQTKNGIYNTAVRAAFELGITPKKQSKHETSETVLDTKTVVKKSNLMNLGKSSNSKPSNSIDSRIPKDMADWMNNQKQYLVTT